MGGKFVLVLVFQRSAPPVLTVPFAVAAVRASWGALRGRQVLSLRRLGWSEVAFSLFFAAFLALGFHV